MDSVVEDQLMELATTPIPASYAVLLDTQRELLLNQMEKLQEIVVLQCRLTDVNPLSQEMAAGALSIKIGKRPRDLMNPKAIQYMQYVFSIKDSTNKRETREISDRFGVTSTQVRDFFTGHRSRVRKLARLSGERGSKSDLIATTPSSDVLMAPVPLNTVIPENIEEGASLSKSFGNLSEVDKSDLHFTKNIFCSMKKEESFAEQVKLLRWILRIKNPSVLDWFLIEGGLLILATWLSEAGKEEQTSYLKVIMKVLHYLPLRNALPAHVSAILQSVNRLRFYRISDISHRARVLLSHWSKIFGKSLSKKNNGLKSASDMQDEMLLKQSIREVMDDESWDIKDENSEMPLGLLCENPNKFRKPLPAPPLKLLAASADETDKKKSVLPSYTRERRKVQILEQPCQKSRNSHASKATPAPQSRPLSADDIQKAKMRAQFIQSKYGKATSSSEKKPANQNGSNTATVSFAPVSKSHEGNEIEEQKKSGVDDSIRLANLHETQHELAEKISKKNKIPWRNPPEIMFFDEWHVANGENSKEVEVQNNRTRREREVFYRSLHEIPSNPREPWDREMDHDDSLTPQIPIDQLPDAEPEEAPSASPNDTKEAIASVASTSSASAPAPDFELLAELLKNPDLVFALTSGKAGAVSNDDIVKLLDMIKSNGLNLMSNPAGNAGHKVEVSLPSPTPSTAPAPNGLKQDWITNPFSRQHNSSNSTGYQPTEVTRLQGINSGQSFVHTPVTRPVESQQSFIQQWENSQHYHISQPNSSNVQQQIPTEMMLKPNTAANSNWNTAPHIQYLQSQQSSYLQEHLVPETKHYQNHQTLNNYRIQPGGIVQQTSRVANWSPDNGRHEYLPGQYYNETGLSLSQVNRSERGHHAQAPHLVYQDPNLTGAGTRRWPERR